MAEQQKPITERISDTMVNPAAAASLCRAIGAAD